MNPNKIKQLVEKMGKPKPTRIIDGIPHWKTGPVAGNKWLYGFNPETSDADMVELLEKLIETQQVSISTYDGKFRVLNCSYGSHSVEAPTLRAAVVSFACKCWGIEE